jgi:hypothetical protein
VHTYVQPRFEETRRFSTADSCQRCGALRLVAAVRATHVDFKALKNARKGGLPHTPGLKPGFLADTVVLGEGN